MKSKTPKYNTVSPINLKNLKNKGEKVPLKNPFDKSNHNSDNSSLPSAVEEWKTQAKKQ